MDLENLMCKLGKDSKRLPDDFNKKLTGKQIDLLLSTVGFSKLAPNTFLAYTHSIYLKNFNDSFYVCIENPTRACKFYTVYGRFNNKDIYSKLYKLGLPVNTDSGKCNYHVHTLIDLIGKLSGIVSEGLT